MLENNQKKQEEVKVSETGDKISILLVDDDKFLIEMYAIKFKASGLAVDVAFSGTEALAKLRAGAFFNIILMDIIMPVMDGLEVLDTIKKEKLAEKSLIVIITNQADDSEKALSLGADGFIVKAMSVPSEVVTKVLEMYKSR